MSEKNLPPENVLPVKSKSFTVEEHNDLINGVSTVIESLKEHKHKLPAREAIKALVGAIGRINELYTSDMMAEQNKTEVEEPPKDE